MFYTRPSDPSADQREPHTDPLTGETPEGKDRALIPSQEQAHSQLSDCQSLSAPCPTPPPWDSVHLSFFILNHHDVTIKNIY